MKMSRPYLETAVGFFKTREEKLTWVIGKNCEGSWDLLIVPSRDNFFGTTNLNEIFTWVYASFVINHGMHSHTRGAISMGMGGTYRRSRKKVKQKELYRGKVGW